MERKTPGKNWDAGGEIKYYLFVWLDTIHYKINHTGTCPIRAVYTNDKTVSHDVAGCSERIVTTAKPTTRGIEGGTSTSSATTTLPRFPALQLENQRSL